MELHWKTAWTSDLQNSRVWFVSEPEFGQSRDPLLLVQGIRKLPGKLTISSFQ